LQTAQECRAFIHLPGRFQRRCFAAHNWRYTPWVGRLKRLLQARPAPLPIWAQFQLSHDFAYKPAYRNSWRSQRQHHPLGPAQTQGIHWIDLIHLWFGPIEWVSGQVMNISRVGSAPDTATLFLKTRSGVACSIDTSYAAPVTQYARIVSSKQAWTCQEGRLVTERQAAARAGQLSRPPKSKVLLKRAAGDWMQASLGRQLIGLREHARGAHPRVPLVSMWEGMRNVLVLEAFARALKGNRRQSLSGLPLYRALWRKDR
jgi:predicted dehydrogenase